MSQWSDELRRLATELTQGIQAVRPEEIDDDDVLKYVAALEHADIAEQLAMEQSALGRKVRGARREKPRGVAVDALTAVYAAEHDVRRGIVVVKQPAMSRKPVLEHLAELPPDARKRAL